MQSWLFVYTVRMPSLRPPLTREDLKNPAYLECVSKVNDAFLFVTCAGDEYKLSPKDLARLDQRLALVMNKLLDHCRSSVEVGNALSATMRYWDNPAPIQLDDIQHVPSEHGTYVLDVIYLVRQYKPGVLSLFHSRSKILTESNVTFAGGRDVRTTSVSYDWCEHHFPGSVGRLNAAFALDLPAKDIIQFGFYAETLPCVAVLPEL